MLQCIAHRPNCAFRQSFAVHIEIFFALPLLFGLYAAPSTAPLPGSKLRELALLAFSFSNTGSYCYCGISGSRIHAWHKNVVFYPVGFEIIHFVKMISIQLINNAVYDSYSLTT